MDIHKYEKNKESLKESLEDRRTRLLIKNWDKVRCLTCKKVISMLTSTPVAGGRGFVCKGGCK